MTERSIQELASWYSDGGPDLESFEAMKSVLEEAQRIKQLLVANPNLEQVMGPIAGRRTSVMSHLYLSPEAADLVSGLNNLYLGAAKNQFGARFTVMEQRLLSQAKPSITQPLNLFNANLETWLRTIIGKYKSLIAGTRDYDVPDEYQLGAFMGAGKDAGSTEDEDARASRAADELLRQPSPAQPSPLRPAPMAPSPMPLPRLQTPTPGSVPRPATPGDYPIPRIR